MAGRGRRKKNNNRAGKLCIGMIVIAFVAVMSVQIIRVYQKDQEYMQQEASLQKQLEEETARGEQLSKKYVQDQRMPLAFDIINICDIDPHRPAFHADHDHRGNAGTHWNE